jgi:hypothetical protein
MLEREIVALDEQGCHSAQVLQRHEQTKAPLHFETDNLTKLPLHEPCGRLEQTFSLSEPTRICIGSTKKRFGGITADRRTSLEGARLVAPNRHAAPIAASYGSSSTGGRGNLCLDEKSRNAKLFSMSKGTIPITISRWTAA